MKQKKNQLSRGQVQAGIVALLFSAGEPLSTKRLAEVLAVKRDEVRAALEEVKGRVEALGLIVITEEEEHQLVTSAESAFFVKKLLRKEARERLGRATLEVLAVVAYRRGATREEIELVRGVNSAQALRILLLKGLIEKKENEGRYRPTLKFLRSAGIEQLEDLPGFDELNEDEKIKLFLKDQ